MAPLVLVAAAAACGGGSSSGIPNVDVSNAPDVQNEVSIAADPHNPDVLVAGSNSFSERTERVYSSTDGGRHWSSRPGPPLAKGVPGLASDPALGIDGLGRQYFAFIQVSSVSGLRSRIVVAARKGPQAGWRSVLVPNGGAADKPSLTTFGDRVYVVWISRGHSGLDRVLLSESGNGGVSWSSPRRVSPPGSFFLSYPSVVVGAGGARYVSWQEGSEIRVARSTGRGDSFQLTSFIADTGQRDACGFPIPAQRKICVRPDPVLVADRARGRVWVTWSDLTENGALDVFARRVEGSRTVRVSPPDGRSPSDQFWAAPAVDPDSGRLWVCFYDTRGDRRRVKAVFSCTASSDAGRTWARPVRVASVASDETQPGAANGADQRQYGDYEGLVVAGGVAHPIWTDTRDVASSREEIYTASITAGLLR